MIVFNIKNERDKKTCTIPLKATEEEKRKLHLAAMELDMTVAQLLRVAVERYLQEEL